MPYHIGERDSNGCSGYPVVSDEGHVAGCHGTESEATAQLGALYANVPDATKGEASIDTSSVSENPSSHINPSVGMRKPQYMTTNQGRPEGSGTIHNKPGVDIWAGSAFGKMIQNELIPLSTYQGCDCETCKEMNVDCPDCPVCANPIETMKADAPLPENPIMPTQTYEGCECDMCEEQEISCADCPKCSGMDAETQMAMYDSQIGKADPCWDGYVQRGMKDQGGKMVPNCVPVSKSDEVIEDPASFAGIGKDYTRSTKEIHRVEE